MLNIFKTPSYNKYNIILSPLDLLYKRDYWISRVPQILLLISIVIISIFILFDFIFPAQNGFYWLDLLSVLILSLLFVGIGWMSLICSKIEIDSSFSAHFKNKVIQNNELIKSRIKDRIKLSEIEEMIPVVTYKDLVVPRLVKHILKNAEDRKFESIMIIMQPYREEIYDDLYKISGLQKTCLQLGIVGTFLGLISGFVAMSEFTEQIELAIPTLIDSLKLSFSTSIAGLLASISLNIGILLIVKKKQENLFRLMEECAIHLTSLCRNSINKDAFINSFDQMKETVDQMYSGVENQNDKIHIQTNVISDGIAKLSRTKDEFDSFLGRITEIEGDFISEMKNIYETLSPERTSNELKLSMNEAVKGISDSLDKNLSESIVEYRILNENLHLMAEHINSIGARIDLQVESFEKHNESLRIIQTQLYDNMKSFSDRQDEFISEITGSHISDNLLSSIEIVGEKMVKGQKKASSALLKKLESLEVVMSRYNDIQVDEVNNRSPFMALKVTFEAVLNLISSIILSIVNLLQRGYKKVFKK